MSDRYPFTSKQELIERAKTCDILAAQRRHDDPHYIIFREWAYEYRRVARERST